MNKIEFKPITNHDLDNFNVYINGDLAGMFYWKRYADPKVGKVGVVTNLFGMKAIVGNEELAVRWLISSHNAEVEIRKEEDLENANRSYEESSATSPAGAD